MTEITEKIASPLYPAHPGPRYLIDPVAFFIALIGGPLIIAVSMFWIMLIPVLALVMGGPIYLAVGIPMLLWHLRHHEANPDCIAVLAFKSVLALCAAGIAFLMITGETRESPWFYLIGGFGLVFGPLWGWCFGWIYLKLRRDIYAPQSS